MEAPLALICIIFMVCITYGVIRATNIQKNHGLACRTIYIPEDLSIKTLLNQIKDLSINELKKKALYVGVPKEKVKELTILSQDGQPNAYDIITLKRMIITNSVDSSRIVLDSMNQGNVAKDRNKSIKRYLAGLNSLSKDNYEDEVTKRLQDIGHKITGNIKKPNKKFTIDNYSDYTNIKALVDNMLVKEKRHIFNKKSKP